jgi:hypothetical protein
MAAGEAKLDAELEKVGVNKVVLSKLLAKRPDFVKDTPKIKKKLTSFLAQ